jgi:hypothetical protein
MERAKRIRLPVFTPTFQGIYLAQEKRYQRFGLGVIEAFSKRRLFVGWFTKGKVYSPREL